MSQSILDIPKVKEKYDHAKHIIEDLISIDPFTFELLELSYALDELKKNNKIYDYRLEFDIHNEKLTVFLKPIRCAETIEMNLVV